MGVERVDTGCQTLTSGRHVPAGVEGLLLRVFVELRILAAQALLLLSCFPLSGLKNCARRLIKGCAGAVMLLQGRYTGPPLHNMTTQYPLLASSWVL